MKLPKGFGGKGFQNVLSQMQGAMAEARELDDKLAASRFDIDKGQVKATFNGLGELQTVKIDPDVVDPEDVEALEDLIVSAMRDGFQRASEERQKRTQDILPEVPGMDVGKLLGGG